MTEKLFTWTLSINQTKTVVSLMYNFTDFLFYTGVNGVISYRNRLSEHNIDIGVISNDYMCRIFNMYKAANIKQYASEKLELCFIRHV